MDESFLGGLLESNDIVVFKKSMLPYFLRLTPAPDWYFNFITKEEGGEGCLDIDLAPPFLQNFFVDALQLPRESEGAQISSGVWIQESEEEGECYFEAKSTIYGGTLVLIIKKLGPDFVNRHQQIQVARERELVNEKLERLVRQRTLEVRQREEEIILRLLAASGAKDDETSAHVRRIGLYSAEVAKLLGWSHEQVDNIRLAAPMHDIGKIGIPDHILLKPGRLTEEEWAIMRTHPELGAEMLGNTDIPVLQMASSISLYHHERYDGAGYPLGIGGEQIPLAARIVAIADVYDALVHERVYKQAVPEKTVLDMMQAQVGKHFDPIVFQTFLSCIDQIRRICSANQDDRHNHLLMA
ncbi:MAG: HD domain-containing protein [Gammaproteobacteria bacterium]|nr:HD domain-containing protein [Gammaproteobacteria bacterium]